MRISPSLRLLAVPLLVTVVACAPVDEAGDEPSAAPETTSGTPTDAETTAADPCATENLALKTPGQLTIATDSPAFPPWFSDNDPTNGEGFESAVAYAVADELGFTVMLSVFVHGISASPVMKRLDRSRGVLSR